jgi:glycosyltransferase involved in cell wall biosynthesis
MRTRALAAETVHRTDRKGDVGLMTASQDVAGGFAPAVSVVIPTYNAAGLTSTCLIALLASVGHRDDVEVIVSDDGSTDDTQNVLAALGDRITVATGETNQGFAAACNAGAAVARGRWLATLGAGPFHV